MQNNTRPVIVATWVGIIINTLLAAMKAAGGILSGSKALLADALHSASDIVGSVVILFAVKIAHKPPDEEHPYGHGKAENIASFIVAFLLIAVGVELSIYSVRVFLSAPPAPPGKLALIIILISLVIKEALFHYKYRLGKKYNSSALISEAWHHRSDSLSSVAALIGILASMLSGYMGWHFLAYGDAVAGLGVSLIVIKVGYSLAKESAIVIMEKVLAEEDVKPYKETISKIPEVKRIDTLYARTHGSYVVMDVRFSVDPNITVQAGHDISKRVKQTLMEEHADIEDVIIHLNPYHP